jgi:hypothetical protein
VPDAEAARERTLGVAEGIVIEAGIRTDDMRRQGRLGGARRPNVQVVLRRSKPAQRGD